MRGVSADILGVATLTRTLYAPNPPQLDDPWLKALLAVIILVAGVIGLNS